MGDGVSVFAVCFNQFRHRKSDKRLCRLRRPGKLQGLSSGGISALVTIRSRAGGVLADGHHADGFQSGSRHPARLRNGRWVRWVARFHKASLFGSMVKLAQMIERHLAGILAHWKWGVTVSFMETL
jgi:hypothetical protein